MQSGIIAAVIAAGAMGVWNIFHDKASTHINPFVGAVVVQIVALIVGLLVLTPQLKSGALHITREGMIWAALAGIAALTIDLFALKAYAAGVPISVGGPIIIGGSIAVAALCGLLFFGETFSFVKVAGIALVIAGASLLAATH